MEAIENTKKKVTLYLTEEQHRAGKEKLASAFYRGERKFQGLLFALYERWLSGEFDAKPDARPVTTAETSEDREILRIVHRPANRAEVLVAETVKHYLRLKAGEE